MMLLAKACASSECPSRQEQARQAAGRLKVERACGCSPRTGAGSLSKRVSNDPVSFVLTAALADLFDRILARLQAYMHVQSLTAAACPAGVLVVRASHDTAPGVPAAALATSSIGESACASAY